MVNITIIKKENGLRVRTTASTEREKVLLTRLDIQEEMELSKFLGKLFMNHKDFYIALGVEPQPDYHLRDTEFNEDCGGFAQFLEDEFGAQSLNALGPAAIKRFTVAIKKKIATLVENAEICWGFSIALSSEKSEDRIEIEPDESSLLITPQAIYKLQLVRVGGNGLEHIRTEVTNSMEAIYQARLDAQLSLMKERILDLEQQIEQMQRDVFARGLELVMKATKLGWEIDLEKMQILYKKRIVVNKIVKDQKTWNIELDKFFVEGLYIPLSGEKVKAFVQKAYHPNVSSSGQVCMGDLVGKPLIKVLEDLPKMLECINLNSAYPGPATEDAEILAESMSSDGEVWQIE